MCGYIVMSMEQNNNNKKKRKKILVVVLVIVSIIVLSTIGYAVFIINQIGNLDYKPADSTPVFNELPTEDPNELTPPPDLPTFVPPTPTVEPTPSPTVLPELKDDIVNILVLGIDTRQPGEFKDARSDVNIILTIDKVKKEVRLTSILRDSLIYYDEIKDYQRLNYALRLYDHPDGVVKTIEDNFGIDIDHYMMADFWGVATLIDIFGGVTVNASDAEISNLNDILWNLNELYDYKDLRTDFVEHKPGDIKLNGRQAVAYMRIRKVGADYERVQRQYEVLDALKSEIAGMNFFEMNKILIKLPDLIKTDMSELELLATANTLYSIRDCEMKNARVPFDGAYKAAKYKKMWILELDMSKTKKLLNQFVYEGKLPE